MNLQRNRNTDLLSPVDSTEDRWKELLKLVKNLAGLVPGHPELNWSEGIATRLDWANDLTCHGSFIQ